MIIPRPQPEKFLFSGRKNSSLWDCLTQREAVLFIWMKNDHSPGPEEHVTIRNVCLFFGSSYGKISMETENLIEPQMEEEKP